MESSCIKQLDFSGGVSITELERFPCLKTCISTIKHENNDKTIINQTKLILVLFKAVQQLQTQIDNLKAK